ncbi:YkgJ family cysteine cluster protein [Niveibacterium sp. 24ML]|uniref:YkgJ family cysteine cluster protein n=1 Tax=Niveibacterium sp. 24ML TaxID=2985512 RepID=UPI002270EC8A|nr:YkgJ family cysteine cluster protein [Niveibacterium sp. 24ML]MCX9157536.1 YkgJ family cysteine cluster protein [Niveibacterium sp. 24ML]
MDCRPGCAACCIAPSISSPIPGMEGGKPAGVPCIQLDEQLRCKLFGDPRRPAVCGGLQPSAEMCGTDRVHALHYLNRLEALTRHD